MSFRKCNMCKNEIPWRAQYWVCSVSTCNRKRTGLAFCSVSCWDAHLPEARHKEAWAEERRAPREGEVPKEPTRAQITPETSPAPESKPATPAKPVVLIRKKTSIP